MEVQELNQFLQAETLEELIQEIGQYTERLNLFKIHRAYSVFLKRQSYYCYYIDASLNDSEMFQRFEEQAKSSASFQEFPQTGFTMLDVQGSMQTVLVLKESDEVTHFLFIKLLSPTDGKPMQYFLQFSFPIFQKLIALYGKIQSLGILDPLTGTYSYSFLKQVIPSELARALRLKEVLSFLYIDLDHFRDINAHYGHETGSAILIQFAKWLQSHVRLGDHIVRMGGDEFIVLMSTPSSKEAFDIAERLRLALSRHPFEVNYAFYQRHFTHIFLTMSVGVHSIQPHENHQFEDVINACRQANFALKEAKKVRNKVFLFDLKQPYV